MLIIKNIFWVSPLEHKIEGSTHALLGEGNGKNLEMFFWDKKVTLSWLMNTDIAKPERFDHLHLVLSLDSTFKESKNIKF